MPRQARAHGTAENRWEGATGEIWVRFRQKLPKHIRREPRDEEKLIRLRVVSLNETLTVLIDPPGWR